MSTSSSVLYPGRSAFHSTKHRYLLVVSSSSRCCSSLSAKRLMSSGLQPSIWQQVWEGVSQYLHSGWQYPQQQLFMLMPLRAHLYRSGNRCRIEHVPKIRITTIMSLSTSPRSYQQTLTDARAYCHNDIPGLVNKYLTHL